MLPCSVEGRADYNRCLVLTVTTRRKVRVAFALDCCDREATAHVATTEGIKSEDVQDLVITAVENGFGHINRLSEPIQWLTDNGSCFVTKNTASLLRDIGMEQCSVERP